MNDNHTVAKVWIIGTLLLLAFICGIQTETGPGPGSGTPAMVTAAILWGLLSFGCVMYHIGSTSYRR